MDAIPGVGPALATALVASIADPGAFRSGRDFSAWVGLVPKQNSSGGKDKLGSISMRSPISSLGWLVFSHPAGPDRNVPVAASGGALGVRFHE
jgi:Transposase IS116/IS110/IS902 family